MFVCLSVILFFEYFRYLEVNSWIYAYLIAYFLCVVFSVNWRDLLNRSKFGFKIYKKLFIYFFSFGTPLIIHQLSTYAKGNLDKLFIYKNFSSADLGLYSVAVQVASIVTILLMAINKAFLPYFFEYIKKNNDKKNILKTVLLSMLVGPFVYLFFFFILVYLNLVRTNLNEIKITIQKISNE